MIATVVACMTTAAVHGAHAQNTPQTLQSNFQVSAPWTQRSYFDDGWVHVLLGVDGLVVAGHDFNCAGLVTELGLRYGLSQKWALEVTFGGGPGWGSRGIAGTQSVAFSHLGAAGSIGRKLYIDRDMFVFAHAGISFSRDSLQDNDDGPATNQSFSLANDAIAVPAGIFASFGRVWQISPGISVSRNWKGESSVKYSLDQSSATVSTAGLMSVNADLDVGHGPLGLYAGVTVQHTFSTDGFPSYTSVFMRLNWSLKLVSR